MSDGAITQEQRPARRVAPVVALTLLETIRRQDLPSEVLEEEDTSRTMPRRLGLSDVVDQQIRRYREEVRRRRRVTDEEIRDLVRLVIRRPDSDEVFFHAGRRLAGDQDASRLSRLLPSSLAFALARRQVGRRLRNLFGRRIGGFAAGPFTLEARAHLFIQADPGGDACYALSGFCEALLRRYAGPDARVAHSRCQARGDDLCRWTVLAEERLRGEERLEGLLMNPEMETG